MHIYGHVESLICVSVWGWKYHDIFSIWDYLQSFPNTRLEVYQMAPGQCFKVYQVTRCLLKLLIVDAPVEKLGMLASKRRGDRGEEEEVVVLYCFCSLVWNSPMKQKKLGVSISRVAAQSRSFSQELTSHSCVSCTGPGQVFSQGISSESFRWYLSPQV